MCDLSCFLGAWILLAGGLRYAQAGALSIDFELGTYGPFFVPAMALAWLAPRAWRQTKTATALAGAARAIRRARPGVRAVMLGAALAAAAASHWLARINRYLAYEARMDLAIYGNACRGALHSTIKADASLLADHFEPLLVVFTPLCRVFDPAKVLLTAGTLAWLAGAVGVFYLARAARWSAMSAGVVAFLYLQFSGFVTAMYYDFHLIELAIGAAPWLWYALVSRRFILLWAVAIVSLGLKESASLSLVGFGAYACFALGGRQRWHGAALMSVGAASFALIMTRVYPHFRAGAEDFYFAKYYAHLGASLGAFTTTALTRPIYFASTLLTPEKIRYVLSLFAPFLFMHALRPATLLAALPAIFINVAANDPSLFGGRYHYEAEIFPALFAGAVVICKDAIARERARRGLAWLGRIGARPLGLRAAWLALTIAAFSGQGLGFAAERHRPESRHLYFDRRLAEQVPFAGKIAANQKVAAHLTSRPALYLIDYWGSHEEWQQADLIVVAYPAEDLGWTPFMYFERAIVPRFARDFELVYQDRFEPSFRVWRRRGSPQQ